MKLVISNGAPKNICLFKINILKPNINHQQILFSVNLNGSSNISVSLLIAGIDKVRNLFLSLRMDRLPIEILANIFSFLSAEDFLKASEVCQKFFDVINTRMFMSKIRFQIKDFNVARRYKSVIFNNLHDNLVKNFNKSCSENNLDSVNELIISEGELIDCNSFTSLVNKFENVNTLQIEGVRMNEKSLTRQPKVKLPNLQVIKFFYTTNTLLSVFTDITNQLKVFKVCLIPHIDIQTREKCYEIVLTILNNNGSLDKLNLYEVNFDDSFLERMPTSLALKSFSMSFCYQSVSPSFSSGFKKFIKSQSGSLEKFKIRTFDHINQEKLSILSSNAVKIKCLNIIICPHCEWSEINFSNFRKLSELKIEFKKFCARVNSTVESFIQEKFLRTRYPQIRRLSMIGMFTLSDEIIFGTISSFPHLEFLEIQYATKVSTKHVYLLKDKLKFLKKINLAFCEFLDNRKTIMC